jgi:hypothetical protein
MKYLYAILLLAAVLTGTAHPAAATVYWSSISTACTPDSSSIQNDRYMSAAESNYIAPKAGKVDPIVLVCAVTPNFGAETPALFLLTYLDATGTAPTASVQAQFVRANRISGARTVIASLNSNNNPDTGVTITTTPFNHVLNFNVFYYYVRITMDRSAASQNIRAIGVVLQTNDPV